MLEIRPIKKFGGHMKNLIIIFSILFSLNNLNASETDGTQIASATSKALADATIEIERNSIFAWEASTEEDEVIVKILNEDDVQIKYGCHLHDKEMICHEEHFGNGDNHYHKDPEADLAFIQSGSTTALTKLQRTLQRRGLNLSVLKSLKVWVHEDDHEDGHEHGTDVWTKFQYQTDKLNTIFALCHVHGDEKSFSCHYAKEGEGEPTLSF